MRNKLLVLGLAALLVIGLALPSWAASFKAGDVDITLGGSARLDVGWQMSDFGEMYDIDDETGEIEYLDVEDSQTTFFLTNPGNSRLKVGASYGDIFVYIESGISSSGWSQRHTYGQWNMGEGNSLLVGHTWSIFSLHFANQRLASDDACIGAGCLYTSRHPQIRFTHKGDNFAFNIAIEDTKVDTSIDGLWSSSAYLAEDIIPAIMASATFTMDMLSITPSVLYQQYNLKGISDEIDDVDISGWGVSLDATAKTDMASIDVSVWYAMNAAIWASLFDQRGGLITAGAPISIDGDDVEDVASFGGFLEFGVPMGDNTLYLGAGYQQSDTEDYQDLIDEEDLDLEDSVSNYALYINYKYSITKGFYIQPEVAYFNWGDDILGEELGSDMYIGVHFQYDF